MKTLKNILEFADHDLGQKIGQNLANSAVGTRGDFSKLKTRIQENSESYFQRENVPSFVIRLSHRGDRAWFHLGADLAAAVKKARDIRDHLRIRGWDETIAKFAPEMARTDATITIGEYMALVQAFGMLRPRTLSNHHKKLRGVVRGVMSLEGRKETALKNMRRGERNVYLDTFQVKELTTDVIVRWRIKFLSQRSAGADRKRGEHTVNALIRCSRALFGKRVIRRLRASVPGLTLPAPVPFEGLELMPEHEADYHYHSVIDARKLSDDAFLELVDEELVIFALALGAGLRRSEIDALCWEHVDLTTGVISVRPYEGGYLKTNSSAGEVILEEKFLEALRQFRVKSSGSGFVLCPEKQPQLDKDYLVIRAERQFESLCRWLKMKGVNSTNKRIHLLRKEFGSHICREYGIHAASASLRHSTIALTSKIYADRKAVATRFFMNKVSGPQPTDLADQLIKRMKEQGLVFSAGQSAT